MSQEPESTETQPSESELRVAESRRRVEASIAGLRAAAHGDLGLRPKSGAWVLPVVGFAVGFGLAVRAFRRRRRRLAQG